MKYCTVCNTRYEDNVSFCPTDGEVLEEDPTALLGTALDGQYQIEAVLGKGGMGAVYRARHILLGDRVAIKVLPPEMRGNTEWLRRFQREGQAARRFRHPNAVTVYDLRTASDGTVYLVMEYVEGHTLDSELKERGRFSPAEAFAILEPVMGVLNAAHAMGVVHRDLKPENVMISLASGDGGPVVKLLDLGIAKMREVAGVDKIGATALTTAGQVLGTPYYMSPEQWGELPRDGSSEIDGRADIYSLGVVLYELIAGQRPFNGKTLSELRRQHVSVTPPPLHETMTGVPERFSNVVARSISKDRGDRQATTGELASELRAALGAEGIVPEPGLSLASTKASATAPRTESPGQRITNADLTAPTIVSDRAPATVGREALAGGQAVGMLPGEQGNAATLPTVIAGQDEPVAGKSEPVPGAAVQSVSAAAAARRRRWPLLFVGAGALVALLIAGAVGYGVLRVLLRPQTRVATKTPSSTSPMGSSSSGGTPAADGLAGAHEIGRYWLEVNTKNKSDVARAGDLVTLQSGQEYKFHFSPSESGYLYIIGPGEQNVPTAFLTAKPSARFGLKTNEVRSGVNFAFPTDTDKKANWLKLDETPGTDEFTIVFSPTLLATPAFFAGPSEHQLTADEQKQWEDFRAPFKANPIALEVVKTSAVPFVSVKVPPTLEEGAPAIFQVRIEHK